jgi:predicted ester cyclase
MGNPAGVPFVESRPTSRARSSVVYVVIHTGPALTPRTPEGIMSVEEKNIALATRWFEEVWNQRRTDTVHELMDPQGVGIGQDLPGVIITSPEDFIRLHRRMLGAFSEFKLTAEDIIASGDKVVVRWSCVAKHTGDDLGMPATGYTVRFSGISIQQYKDGKLIRGWDNWDQLALQQQLTAEAEKSASA